MIDKIKVEDIVFDDRLDSDNELNICVENCGTYGDEEDRYINKADAERIINHLRTVFDV